MTFYGSTIRKFRFTISKVCFEFSRAHARSASALSARNAANATLIVLPFDVHRRYLTIYPSLHPVIDYRPWRGMNTRVGYVRGQCVLSVCVCVCVPCAQFVARPASIRKWRQENRYDVLSLVIVWIRVIPCTRRMERNLTNRIVVWTNDKERNVTLILFNKEKSQSFIYLRPCRAWLSLALRSIGQSYTWWHMHFQKKIGHCFAHL